MLGFQSTIAIIIFFACVFSMVGWYYFNLCYNAFTAVNYMEYSFGYRYASYRDLKEFASFHFVFGGCFTFSFLVTTIITGSTITLIIAILSLVITVISFRLLQRSL